MQDKKQKRFIFQIDDDLHARLKIALFYDRMGQSQFFKHIITGYLANNVHLRNFMDELLEKQLSHKKKKNRAKDRKEEAETIKDFALNEEEVQNIFDLIESENPDL